MTEWELRVRLSGFGYQALTSWTSGKLFNLCSKMEAIGLSTAQVVVKIK